MLLRCYAVLIIKITYYNYMTCLCSYCNHQRRQLLSRYDHFQSSGIHEKVSVGESKDG